jgi:hypothetical protein
VKLARARNPDTNEKRLGERPEHVPLVPM